MLVISRKSNETLVVGDKIEIRVLGAKNDSVRLGIVAPRDVTVVRGEILEKVREQNLASLSLDLKALQRVAEKALEKRPDWPCVEIPETASHQSLVNWLVHDTRNFLTPIHGEIQLALLDCPDGELRDSLESVQSHVSGLNGWLRTTATLASSGGFCGQTMLLKDALIEAVGAWTGKAMIHLSCPDYLEVPRCEPGLGAMLLHLFQNAEEAGAEEVKVVALKGEHGLELSVRDNGIGIDRSSLDNLRRPFFSTRLNHRGRGLFLVRSWVAGFNGKMTVSSLLGTGTEVTLCLNSRPARPARKACDVILKAPFRGTAHALLESLGFTVLLGTNKAEFELLVEQFPTKAALDPEAESLDDWLNTPG